MYLFLVILMVVASLLMCFIVLIQNSKGGGLASGFSSSNQIMGVRKTTDFLEKGTWFLAGFIDRKSTRLNSSHWNKSRMPSSA